MPRSDHRDNQRREPRRAPKFAGEVDRLRARVDEIPDRLGHPLDGEGLPLHRHVALLVGRRPAEDLVGADHDACDAKPACSMPMVKWFALMPCRSQRMRPFRLQS